jgi:hypothetical protein
MLWLNQQKPTKPATTHLLHNPTEKKNLHFIFKHQNAIHKLNNIFNKLQTSKCLA